MARGSFGGGASDSVENAAGARQSGVIVTMWSAETGGTQYTDLLLGAVAVPSVTSGSIGRLPVFFGPDSIVEMWADAGGGVRSRLESYTGASVYPGTVLVLLWNGTNFTDPNGVAATAANRPAKTYRMFIGGPDAAGLGLKIDGDNQVVA